MGELTLQSRALRPCLGWAPAEGNGTADVGLQRTAISFERTVSVQGYNDITPRMGVAYNLWATARPRSDNLGKYLRARRLPGPTWRTTRPRRS